MIDRRGIFSILYPFPEIMCRVGVELSNLLNTEATFIQGTRTQSLFETF